MPSTFISKTNIIALFNQCKAFLSLFINHVKQDNITVSAGHLAYVSLLSLVPFIMVFFTILSAFPAFAETRGEIEELIFESFIPSAGSQVSTYMTEFINNASGMGAIGILSLMVVALMLISNIDKTLNRIWQSKSERPIVFTLAIYWMVLTLGPLLMGASVAVSSYLVGLANYAEEYTFGFTTFLLKFVPFLMSISAFFILYMLVPNKKIEAKHALAGAFVAASLFELSKKGFAFYITSFPSYQVIYGALAVIPILFLWVYLSWIVILVGAEFTRVLELFLGEESEDKFSEDVEETSVSPT
ncbi:MAG: virulence factor BrkB family protein [Paraglaciecola sp.]|uniref:virulence factor BrkB family protein n=1 Tax=Paraglaciecola sp. TaxID=1920173 RepID=UPI0032975A32